MVKSHDTTWSVPACADKATTLLFALPAPSTSSVKACHAVDPLANKLTSNEPGRRTGDFMVDAACSGLALCVAAAAWLPLLLMLADVALPTGSWPVVVPAGADTETAACEVELEAEAKAEVDASEEEVEAETVPSVTATAPRKLDRTAMNVVPAAEVHAVGVGDAAVGKPDGGGRNTWGQYWTDDGGAVADNEEKTGAVAGEDGSSSDAVVSSCSMSI